MGARGQYATLLVLVGFCLSVLGNTTRKQPSWLDLDPPVKHCNAKIGYNRCYGCDEGYQIVNYPDGSQKCVACKSKVKNCMWCADDGTTCQRCEVGYRMIVKKNGKKICKKCKARAGKKCFTCSLDRKRCIECLDEFYLTTKGTCKLCPGAERQSYRKQDSIEKQCNPKETKDKVNGMTCNPGYRFLDDGVQRSCKRCKPKNCDYCTEDRKTCTYCSSGYTLSGDGGCTPCREKNCYACPNDPDTCLACETGYWLNNKQGGVCQKCPKNCRVCGDTDPTCTICSDGYGFTKDEECTACKVSKCENCSEDYTSCIFCESDYRFNGTMCVPWN